MTENKATEILEYVKTFEGMDFGATKIALDMAIQVLEEIQAYRAIGTPTQIYEKIGGLDVELGKYHSIGTIDEFKALKEMVEHLLTRHLHQTIELYGRQECVNNLEPILLNFGISSEVLDKYRP